MTDWQIYNINWANQYEVMGVCLKDDNNNYGDEISNSGTPNVCKQTNTEISSYLIASNYILCINVVSPELK